jgi:antitoxin (DNA-binding transcriptional repressor) of toxin-antitoxin stability system
MTIRAIDIGQAIEPLGEYADHIDDGVVVVTRSGQPVAVLVPIENTDLETIALSQDPRFLALVERSRRRYRDEGGRTLAEVERELGTVGS